MKGKNGEKLTQNIQCTRGSEVNILYKPMLITRALFTNSLSDLKYARNDQIRNYLAICCLQNQVFIFVPKNTIETSDKCHFLLQE